MQGQRQSLSMSRGGTWPRTTLLPPGTFLRSSCNCPQRSPDPDELLLANHCHLLAALAFVIVQEQLSENEFKFHKDFSHDKPSCASITLIIVSTQTLILQSWRINIQVKQAAK